VRVVSTEARDCAAYAAVRGDRLDAYRAEQAVSALAWEDAVAQRRAEGPEPDSIPFESHMKA
jgi:hypothetical protein